MERGKGRGAEVEKRAEVERGKGTEQQAEDKDGYIRLAGRSSRLGIRRGW